MPNNEYLLCVFCKKQPIFSMGGRESKICATYIREALVDFVLGTEEELALKYQNMPIDDVEAELKEKELI